MKQINCVDDLVLWHLQLHHARRLKIDIRCSTYQFKGSPICSTSQPLAGLVRLMEHDFFSGHKGLGRLAQLFMLLPPPQPSHQWQCEGLAWDKYSCCRPHPTPAITFVNSNDLITSLTLTLCKCQISNTIWPLKCHPV